MYEKPDDMDPLALTYAEWEILNHLLEAADDGPLGWPLRPIEDVVGRLPNPIVALEALTSLYDVGLIQRRENEVMITRAALRFHHLVTAPPDSAWLRRMPWA